MSEYTLKSFSLGNYKSIEQSPSIDLEGLTLVLGPNSSGKTNMLESLVLLKQSLDQGDVSLTPNGEYVDLGEYRDIVHMKDSTKRIKYKFTFQRDSTQGDDDVRFECPICHREYQRYKGHYTNHLADEHPQFWKYCDEQYGHEVKKYEDFLISDTSIEIFYRYDEDVKSNMLDELVFTNLPPSRGLFLSELRIKATEHGFDITASDIEGRHVFKIPLIEEKLNIDYPDELSDILGIIRTAVRFYFAQHGPEGKYIQTMHSGGQVGENEVFPEIYKESEKIDEMYEATLREKEDSIDDYKESRLKLAVGLLARFNSIMRVQRTPVDMLNETLDEMVHVGPLRRNPQRVYFGRGMRPGQLYSQGENFEDMIFKAQQSGKSELIGRTNEWLSECGFDVQLGISEVGFGDLYQLVVKENGLSVNLADSGFGLSQTLPIIVRAVNMGLKKERGQEASKRIPWSSPRFRAAQIRPIMLIEQPEIHLNPRIEADIGDFFINIVKSDIDLLIETHSEHLLNRVQRRVADGTIEDEDRISIYFVEKPEDKSKIREITMDSSGRFEDWPSGFFQDDFEEAVEILKESLPNSDEVGNND